MQNRLVNDLIDVSRIQTNQLDLQLAPCDLVMIVREVVEDQRIVVPTRTIRWDTSVLEADVLADANKRVSKKPLVRLTTIGIGEHDRLRLEKMKDIEGAEKRCQKALFTRFRAVCYTIAVLAGALPAFDRRI